MTRSKHNGRGFLLALFLFREHPLIRYTSADLLHRYALRQIARLIHIAAA